MEKKEIETTLKAEAKEDWVVERLTGRPSKYEQRFCQMLIDHMSNGFSFESFAGTIDVNRDTLYEWEKVHLDFSDAKKTAVEKGLLFWEKIGIDYVVNVSESSGSGESATHKSKSLNASAWIFNMKNRFKWRDKQADEQDSININVTLADKMAKARERVGKK